MPSDLSNWMQQTDSKSPKSKTVKPPKKQTNPSILLMLQKEIENQPVRPPEYPHTPKSGPPGVLLDVEYDGDRAQAKLKLFDLETMKIYEWFDITGHHPYCLTDITREELSQQQEVVGHPGFLQFEETKRLDLLHDREQQLVTILARDPLAIGGRPNSIREIIGRDRSWEADIRYHHCFTMDRELTPGLYYRVQDGRLVPVPQEYSAKDSTQIEALFEKDSEAARLVKEFLPLFLTQAVNLPRIAIDIEVESPAIDRIPDPVEAPFPVITVSLIDDTGTGLICLLKRDSDNEDPTRKPPWPKGATIKFFEDEQSLLQTIFKILWRAPLVLTYNGDNFDLRYLTNRAKKLNIPPSEIPMSVRGTQRGQPEAQLYYGVHIDLYRFFHNRSIQIYAFRNRYQEVRLEDVSQALLGEGKRPLTKLMSDLSPRELADYCYQDARLTMGLSQMDDNLVLNLILLLMRVAHMGMHDLTRTAVSGWIRSLLYYAHRQRNYLIPRQDEIAAMKGEAVTEAIIKGKKYMGAIVVEPKTGVHFNVTLVDFASLYPSIMKAYNLSYETVRCEHPECKNNQVPDTPHWICTKREGLTSLIIGVIRDVRVEYFKPRAKDKTLTSALRSWYSVVEQALKVYLNACLPYGEEVIVRNKDKVISKRPIGSLKDDWINLEVLSIDNNTLNDSFGTPTFVPIKGFAKTGRAGTLRIVLSDGRTLKCTANHVIPKLNFSQIGRRRWKEFRIGEVPAGELKKGDEILICNQVPLTHSPPDALFIPDLLKHYPLMVGMKRSVYKRFSYRRNQSTENPLIQIINEEFHYAKALKIYKALWSDLSEKAKQIIRSANSDLLLVKIAKDRSFWINISVPLSVEFFKLMGWYLAEGNAQQNRFSISQYQDWHPQNFKEIERLLKSLGWPYGCYSGNQFTVNSKIFAAVVSTLFGSKAQEKRIPLELLDEDRSRLLLESFFKGDGNFTLRGKKRYSTSSGQLAKDLVTLLGTLGKFSSIHNDSNIYRIIETAGRNYKRKYKGLITFNNTFPVKIREIISERELQPVFDLETGNGWFVATNGIVTHNSYGVLGASHFPLYCAPAAESITALGRYAITQTIQKAEELGVTVLYGDTDSLFLESPPEEALWQLLDWSERALKVELDVEKEYRYVALSSRKKNYLGVTHDGLVDIKGLTGKKRNTPAFLQEAFMQMVDILRQVKNPDDFAAAKDRILRLAREKLTMLERREFEVADLAIRVQLTKPVKAYVKTTPQHVKAAHQLEEAGREVMAGDIIAFVKTVGGVKPVEHATVQDADISKYKELVRSTFEQVLDALGIEWMDTIGMRRLDSFFG